MDKQHFDQLVKGVLEMKRHMAGKSVRGITTTELEVPGLTEKVTPSSTSIVGRRRYKKGIYDQY